jgi:hypothetical protein
VNLLKFELFNFFQKIIKMMILIHFFALKAPSMYGFYSSFTISASSELTEQLETEISMSVGLRD